MFYLYIEELDMVEFYSDNEYNQYLYQYYLNKYDSDQYYYNDELERKNNKRKREDNYIFYNNQYYYFYNIY